MEITVVKWLKLVEPFKGYNTLVGQKHRLGRGVWLRYFLECSTPEQGVTWRLEDDYSRPDGRQNSGQRAQ